jgi:hypothetical protein
MPKGRAKGTKIPERPVVNINDEYRVQINGYNLILQRYAPSEKTDREEDENSTDGWHFVGYFTTWDGVLWKIFNIASVNKIRQKKIIDVIELKKVWMNVKDEINAMVKRMPGIKPI